MKNCCSLDKLTEILPYLPAYNSPSTIHRATGDNPCPTSTVLNEVLMPYSLEDKLVVAITARSLFDLEEATQVYTREGIAAYRDYQLQRENEPLGAGVGMPMVRALLGIADQASDSL